MDYILRALAVSVAVRYVHTMEIEPREIVQAASKKVRNPVAKSWLFRDEHGTWEEAARNLLGSLRVKYPTAEAEQREHVIEELSERLILAALTTLLEEAKKGRPGRRPRG